MGERGDTIRVLHVDDDPGLADVAATFLGREDERITVRSATSATDGVAVLESDDIDCVVSDYDMPGRNGIDFLEAVRDRYPDLPFILYTGKGSEEVASEAVSAGVTDYMQKGTGTDQYAVLANRVTNSVEQYRAQREAERTRRRLEELSESTTDCLWMFDRDWEELLFISGYEAVWDRSESAIRENPQDFLNGVHPDDREFVGAAMERLSGGEPVDIEYRILRGDGEQGAVWVKGQPVFEDGEVVRVVGFTRDITDRREQARQLETLTNNLPGIAYRARNEPGWPMEVVRGDCEAVTGYTADEVERGAVGWGSDVLHPNDREEIWEAVQEAVEADRPFEVTYRIQTEGGETKWMWERGRLVDAERNNEQVLEGFITDITERKERQRDLRRRDRRYQAVFNDPNILAGLVDTDGTVLDINRTAMEYVDATREAVVGARLWEVPWTDGTESRRTEVRDVIERAADGEYLEFHTELRRPDGTPYAVEGVVRPVTADDGEVVSLLVSARDVTERREREQELQQYEAYLEESTDIITVLDEDGTVRYQSPAVTRLLGYEQGELVGKNSFELVHPDDEAELAEQFEELLAEPGATTTAECRFETADGDWAWLEVHGKNQLENDAIQGVVTNNRVITEWKDRERELNRQNEQLEEFASVVSHDLRNPLNVAEARLGLLAEECNSEHVEPAENALDRMGRIIEDVLWLARTGKHIGATEAVDLREAARSAWEMVGADADEAGLGVDLTDRAEVEADRHRLGQLLENLFRNAVEHGSTSSRLQADEAVEHGGADVTVTVGELEDGFYVADDGPGVPAEERKAVFDAGYTTSQEGTGFGLSIIERIAEAHGWAVELTEGTAGGARFEVTGVEFVGE